MKLGATGTRCWHVTYKIARPQFRPTLTHCDPTLRYESRAFDHIEFCLVAANRYHTTHHTSIHTHDQVYVNQTLRSFVDFNRIVCVANNPTNFLSTKLMAVGFMQSRLPHDL